MASTVFELGNLNELLYGIYAIFIEHFKSAVLTVFLCQQI